MAIMRIGRAHLRVMDLDDAVRYYTNVIGLDEVAREGDKVYLKAWDEYDHHSLILEKADSPGLDHFAFKVEKEDDLAFYEKRVEQFGCTLQRVSRGTRVGEGEAIRFELPTGHQVELYHKIETLGTKVGVWNPDPWPEDTRGIAPHRLDHVLLTGEDVKTVTRFFTEALGLYQSERVMTVDGEDMVGSFLYAANGKPHDVAFIKGPDKKMHHTAFFVESWHDVLKAADILARNDVHIEITPTRHGLTRGQTVYFFDPSGNRNEAFAGGYTTYPDFPTITWTEDKIMHGIFYHRRMLIEESYMKALT
ncbi:MAG: catechol 2,3-dioxygenase [Alicyclobacillus herbarius]|uniref:catechol 2,3-dioxygenase n=1 Tax=Alicyclobacillus herbarius TaxID=122960 RepID=UPI000407377F|nr:catechol 2,3-dioxygenase [Alicyclobacillus herbarius]MCL6631830.1 catechol 2,3-dioxygenase [Alicyclobacillus herbarius]